MDKKFALQVIGLVLLIFLGIGISVRPQILKDLGFPVQTNPLNNSSQNPPNSSSGVVGILNPSSNSLKGEYKLEIVDTDEKRKQGLGGRQSLATDSGMLFVFENLRKPRFWMKGMNFPIDIIWIKDDAIVDILQNVQPPPPDQKDSPLEIYEPITEINKVLEVNAGEISRKGIKVGDKLEYSRR